MRSQLRDRVHKALSPIHGIGLFARVPFPSGGYIGTFEGRPVRRNGTYVLWARGSGQSWVGRSGRNLLRYLNHSDDPNAEFCGFDLYARRSIQSGEEITFDYGGSENFA